MKPFYSIKVDPGNQTIRKRADQVITATLTGFTAPKVRFFAKYASASQWEQAEMRTEAGRLVLPVPDRGRARIAGILRGSRRRAVATRTSST